jgi:hypothetical protein
VSISARANGYTCGDLCTISMRNILGQNGRITGKPEV